MSLMLLLQISEGGETLGEIASREEISFTHVCLYIKVDHTSTRAGPGLLQSNQD